jgi:ankyrin repeat protein
VKLLLDKGANIEAKTLDGNTALITAVTGAPFWNSGEAVKLLLEKGANANVKGSNGDTPLSLAEKAGSTDIVNLLRAHGAQ